MANELITQTCGQLRGLFDKAVQRNLTDGILLSGGLDTSVIAATARKFSKLRAITVALEDAPDLSYATTVADLFGMQHTIVRIDLKTAEDATQEVIEVMRTFDPMEVRNDVTLLIGLRAAKKEGLSGVLTGDAGDELFAGYSFLFEKGYDQLGQRLENMWKTMRFSSAPLARSLGMEAKLPFLEDKFQAFAMSVNPKLKVHEEHGRVYGKWILRKAFEGSLPDNVVWRMKMPIEQGSGTSKLPEYFASRMSDDKFEAQKKNCLERDGVRINDKEHLAYYEAFKEEFGIPRGMGEGAKKCKGCGAWLMQVMNYCRICGAFPA
ncbi:MAG: asparagine synthase-related protein [Candidatus Bathyarchaeia archaeon]